LAGDGLDDFLWEATIATKVATSGEEEEARASRRQRWRKEWRATVLEPGRNN